MRLIETVSDVTVTWYVPYGHGQGFDCQAVVMAPGTALLESCEGGTQNAPDRSTLDVGSSHGGIVGLAAGRAEGEATLAAGSGFTWMFGRKPAGGR